jgi:FAD/FMN-containing dehydrogenase
MNAAFASGRHFAEVHPRDPLYRDLQLRGYNRRFVGTPDSVFVVNDTNQVMNAVDAAVASGKKLAVRSGGHCTEGLVDDPAVRCLIDLGQMDSVYYDRHRRAFAVEPGATLGRVYKALDMSWGVTLPGGSSARVGMGGHVIGGGFGPLSRLYGQISDHLYAVETVVVDENSKAKAVTATREENDPHRDLWWAHTGGGGGNFGVATKFWFRSRDAQGDDPTLLLPKRPSGYTMASVAWRWADLDEVKFTTLVNNYMHWCERNGSPGSPAACVYGTLVLFRKEFGVVSLTGQVDPGQPQSREALDTYFAEVTANVPNGTKKTQADAPWQYTTIHVPEVADVLGIPATQLRSKAKGAFLRSALDGSQVRTIFERLTSDDYRSRGAMAVFVTWGGKMNALSPQDTAVAARDSVALFSVGNFWDNPEEDETHLAWNRTLYRDVFAATGGVPVPNDRTGGCWINWPDPDLLDEEWNQSGVPWSELYYGGNYKRLQEAKGRWDPHQVFNHVLSIEPGPRTGVLRSIRA